MPSEMPARRFAVISGKGGVGKTVITANLAAALATCGKRTLVLDADLGLANMDVILGLNAEGSIEDVLAGRMTEEEAIVHTRLGFDLLPAGSGLLESTLLTPDLTTSMESLLQRLESRYDAILFDVGAGIGEVVLFFARIADEVVVVVTPEPTSLMDAYALIKILSLRFACRNFRLVVNHADPSHPEHSGMVVAARLQQVVSRFLEESAGAQISIRLSGSLPTDPSVARAVSRQQSLAETDPMGPVASRIPRLAESLSRSLP
jgi:flagellar biosynthesis protein FlhG